MNGSEVAPYVLLLDLATLLGKNYMAIVDPLVFNVSLKMAFDRRREED